MVITGKTKLLAVIGSPVEHSLSPIIHNYFAQSMKLPYAYMAFEVTKETLAGFIGAVRTLNISGFNVTMPLKEAIMPYLDALSDDARMIGAVNTVVYREGRLCGHNTDGNGFVWSLRDKVYDFKQNRAVILGTGGAAKAIGLTLQKNGFSVTIASRRVDSIERLKGIDYCHFNELDTKELCLASKSCPLLINATPLGMSGNHQDFTDLSFLDSLSPGALIYDLVYIPRETTLVREGLARGFNAINGLPDLLYQAALAFELFTGFAPSSELIGLVPLE